jgi:hypothetical protein
MVRPFFAGGEWAIPIDRGYRAWALATHHQRMERPSGSHEFHGYLEETQS